MGGKKKKKKYKKGKKGRRNQSPSDLFYKSDEEPDALFVCDHLNLANAKEQHLVVSEKYHKHFTCGICQNIVFEPKECTQCETLFCKLCINKWVSNKDNTSCPAEKKCPDAVYKRINVFMAGILRDLKFNCKIKDCSH